MLVSIKEASRVLEVSEVSLRMKIHRGTLRSEKVMHNNRPLVLVDITKRAEKHSYEFYYQAWIDMQKSGLLTDTPLSKRGVEANVYGLRLFWRKLGEKPDVNLLTVDNLKLAISRIPIEFEKRTCHFSQKFTMTKAVRSFVLCLIKLKVFREDYIKDFRGVFTNKHRKFTPRKTVFTKDSLRDFLELVNESYPDEFRRKKMLVIVMLMSHAGIRRQEVVDLKIKDINFAERTIFIECGKGFKQRTIGLCNDLVQPLLDWIEIRGKQDNDWLIVQKNGRRFSTRLLNDRIQKLREKFSVDITPHGLRRTFATLNAQAGVPLVYIQHQLGHTDIKQTMSYIMTDEREAIKAIQMMSLL